MDEEKCTGCKNELVLGEKSQCIYCELSQKTGNKSCPKCSTSVLRNKGSLYCELCKCFYHNSCNEFPLNDQYCTLLYDVPRNIKWFCDTCVWDTEKWISNYLVNDSSDVRTDTIENANIDNVKDIHDQENYAKSNNYRNKQNPKCKKESPSSDCIKSKILSSNHVTRAPENKDRCITKNNPSNVEENIAPNQRDDINEDDVYNVSIITNLKKEDTNYDSTLEADDLDYHPWEPDSDSDSEVRKKHIGKAKSKKKHPKKKKSNKYQCDQCPKTYVKEHVFVAHKLWHTGDKKPYKCDLCTECFINKTCLDQHKMKHSGEYPFTCDICGKGKASLYLLKCHIKIIHSEEKPFTCTECDFSSRTNRKLKAHIRHSHTVLEILKCTLCEYQTKIKKTMKKHMRDHTGENCFMCDECGQTLKSLAYLKNHQLIHTGEKPVKCKLCEKTFRTRSNLRVHMFVHTKEKKAFCPVCGYGFITKDKLNLHLKTVHTDEKPFECEICGSKYKTKHNLKNHQTGKRGSCHPNNTRKPTFESLQHFKSTSESNTSDSNDSHLVPIKQSNQQPPLLFYAGGNEKSMTPAYSNSHSTATIHCPPPYLSVINYMDH